MNYMKTSIRFVISLWNFLPLTTQCYVLQHQLVVFCMFIFYCSKTCHAVRQCVFTTFFQSRAWLILSVRFLSFSIGGTTVTKLHIPCLCIPYSMIPLNIGSCRFQNQKVDSQIKSLKLIIRRKFAQLVLLWYLWVSWSCIVTTKISSGVGILQPW